MKNNAVQKILRFLHTYVVYFLLIAFVITSCLMLFLNHMMRTMNLQLTGSDIETAAKLTMVNVLFLGILFTIIDAVRRKFMVDRPVKRITDAAKRICQGDFSVQIPHVNTLDKGDGFNEIIDSINLMAKELSGTETLKVDFISNVSHELKTPLAAIQNYGTLLQTPGLPEEKRLEYAHAVTDSTKKLSDLITNILRLNKLENQRIYPKGETYNLSEQLCECILHFENIWEARHITIDTEIEDNVMILADGELLSLVWNNLLSNAMKFTEAGGSVKITLRTEGETAVVSVADTGCGMDADTGRHIFDKFYQGDTSHATQGNGLGLALVKKVMDITKNDIAVESQLGKGTVSTVKIRKNRDGKENG